MSTYLLWNEFGNMYSKMGNLDSAVDAFQKAIELAPDVGLPYSNLGMCYFRQGEHVKAISLCQRSIELSGTSEEKALFWNRLGEIHASLGEYDDSVAAYKKAKSLTSGGGSEIQQIDFVQEGQEFFPDEHEAAPRQEGNVILTEEVEDGLDQNIDDEAEFENWLEELEKESSVESDSIQVDSEINAWDVENHDIQESEQNEDGLVDFDSESPLQPGEGIEIRAPIDFSDQDQSLGDENDAEEELDLNRLKFAKIEPPDGFWSEEWRVLPEMDEQDSLENPEEPLEDQVPLDEEDQRFAVKVTRQLKEIPWLSPLLGSSNPEDNTEERINLSQDQEPVQTIQQQEIDDFESTQGATGDIEPVADEMIKTEESASPQNGGEDRLADDERADTEDVALQDAHEEINGQTLKSEGPGNSTDDAKNELQDAIAIYERITHLAPMNDKAWDKLGNLYKDVGSFDQARCAYEKAISVSPAQALYHYHLGLVNTAQKNYEDAIVTFKKIIEMNPDYVLAHCALAGCYRRLGMDAEADEHVEIARPHMQSESEYNQACFEAICGNTEEAIQLLAIAIENEQTTIDWISVDPDLDFIRDEPRFQSLINQEYEDSEVEVRFL